MNKIIEVIENAVEKDNMLGIVVIILFIFTATIAIIVFLVFIAVGNYIPLLRSLCVGIPLWLIVFLIASSQVK